MARKNEEEFFSGKAPPAQAMGLRHIRQYTATVPPAENEKLWTMLLKLDGYGVADQSRRLLLLTDQNNRTFALRYLAQHLDLVHLMDLVQSLHILMARELFEFEKGRTGFVWPWQWGPEPPKHELVPLPHLVEGKWGFPEEPQPQGVSWPDIRRRMADHEILEVYTSDKTGAVIIRCACAREFGQGDGPTAEERYSTHIRAKVKELFKNGKEEASTAAQSTGEGGTGQGS